MSSDNKSAKPEKKISKEKAVKKVPKKSGSGLIKVFFILLAIIVGFAGFLLINLNKQRVHALTVEQNIDLLKENMQGVQTQSQSQAKQLQQQQTLLHEIQQTYLPKGQQRYWALTNADALARMANYQLHFSQNVPAAIHVLQYIDNEMSQLNDPSLLSIRQNVGSIITQLEALPTIDKESILVKITGLSEQIANLPTNMVEENQFQQEPIKAEEHQQGWKNALNETWRQLQSIVVIQYHEQPITPLLTPERRAYFDQQLSLLLTQAQWAFMQNDAKLYQQSLQLATQWVENNYASKASQVQSFLKNLKKLSSIQLNTTYPDLSPLIIKISDVKKDSAQGEA